MCCFCEYFHDKSTERHQRGVGEPSEEGACEAIAVNQTAVIIAFGEMNGHNVRRKLVLLAIAVCLDPVQHRAHTHASKQHHR